MLQFKFVSFIVFINRVAQLATQCKKRLKPIHFLLNCHACAALQVDKIWALSQLEELLRVESCNMLPEAYTTSTLCNMLQQLERPHNKAFQIAMLITMNKCKFHIES